MFHSNGLDVMLPLCRLTELYLVSSNTIRLAGTIVNSYTRTTSYPSFPSPTSGIARRRPTAPHALTLAGRPDHASYAAARPTMIPAATAPTAPSAAPATSAEPAAAASAIAIDTTLAKRLDVAAALLGAELGPAKSPLGLAVLELRRYVVEEALLLVVRTGLLRRDDDFVVSGHSRTAVQSLIVRRRWRAAISNVAGVRLLGQFFFVELFVRRLEVKVRRRDGDSASIATSTAAASPATRAPCDLALRPIVAVASLLVHAHFVDLPRQVVGDVL
jgi:hypothetical protein